MLQESTGNKIVGIDSWIMAHILEKKKKQYIDANFGTYLVLRGAQSEVMSSYKGFQEKSNQARRRMRGVV